MPRGLRVQKQRNGRLSRGRHSKCVQFPSQSARHQTVSHPVRTPSCCVFVYEMSRRQNQVDSGQLATEEFGPFSFAVHKGATIPDRREIISPSSALWKKNVLPLMLATWQIYGHVCICADWGEGAGRNCTYIIPLSRFWFVCSLARRIWKLKQPRVCVFGLIYSSTHFYFPFTFSQLFSEHFPTLWYPPRRLRIWKKSKNSTREHLSIFITSPYTVPSRVSSK